MIRTPRRIAIAAVLVAVATTTFVVAQQSAPHTAALAGLSLDTLADGTVVVTLEATGELAGLITLRLRSNGGGTFDGEWAITVAHADNTDPVTGEEPEHEEGIDPETGLPHQHKDFLQLVHRGALAGSIAGAQLTFDPQGGLTDFTAPLTVQHGFNEFDGATGSGEATLTALTLTF